MGNRVRIKSGRFKDRLGVVVGQQRWGATMLAVVAVDFIGKTDIRVISELEFLGDNTIYSCHGKAQKEKEEKKEVE